LDTPQDKKKGDPEPFQPKNQPCGGEIMKLKKEYLLPIGIIVVLLVFLLIGGGKNKMSYRVPKLESLSTDDINRIEIVKGEDVFILSAKDDKWTILPQEFPAEPDKISNILETIGNLTLTELASEKKDYLRYELDEENKIGVKAYKDDEILREFDIGKVSATYRHTFVTIGEDTRVYHARDSFRSNFDFDLNDLRDKSVMSFDKNEITQVKIAYEDSTYLFTKTIVPMEESPAEGEVQDQPETAQDEEGWVTEDGTKGKKTEIDTVLNQLTDLKCDSFIEGKSKEDFTAPVHTVSLTGSKEYVLQIFAKDEEEDKYPAISSESPYLFYLTAWKAENIMKKAEDLLDKETEEEK
jgi:hypothetical protein